MPHGSIKTLNLKMKTNKQPPNTLENKMNEKDAHILAFVSQMVTVGMTEKISVQEMTEYIEKIYETVSSLFLKNEDIPMPPAVPIYQSVTDDYLVCLEDGEKFKMIKRHLEAVHGMTFEEYREKWNLPEDYPVTCKNYSAIRRKFAKKVGLGTVNRGHSLKASGKKK